MNVVSVVKTNISPQNIDNTSFLFAPILLKIPTSFILEKRDALIIKARYIIIAVIITSKAITVPIFASKFSLNFLNPAPLIESLTVEYPKSLMCLIISSLLTQEIYTPSLENRYVVLSSKYESLLIYTDGFFESAMLHKPVYSTADDYENFIQSSNMSVNANDFEKFLFCPLITSAEDLAEELKKIDEYDFKPMEKFREWMFGSCDGHSVERVIQFILNDNKECLY